MTQSTTNDAKSAPDGELRDSDAKPAPSPPPKPQRPPFYKRPLPMLVLFIIIVVGIIVGVLYWRHSRDYESTDDAFIEGHVVAVSPRVAGLVRKVYIDDNTRVKVGDLLVELDDSDYQAALVQAQGDYASAEAKVKQARAQIPVSEANIAQASAQLLVAQANAKNAQDNLNRFLALDVRARSKEQMDNAVDSQRTTNAQVEAAKAQLAAARAQLVNTQVAVQTAQGDLKTAEGTLEQARNNVGYCYIRAESDGVITRKNVEPGDYIAVDQPMFSIVRYDVWVVANFKETQLDHIRPGQTVNISVDAYPGRKITGKVQSIQDGTGSQFSLLPPENATGNYVKIVQRVPVKIILDEHQNDDRQHLLSPGMSVEPSVSVR